MEKKSLIKTKKIIFLKEKRNIGFIHPLNKIIEEIENIFFSIGYLPFYSPEIETKENNFDKLEIKKDHPARSEKDTFYFNNDLLLRTHTTNTEVRLMELNKKKNKQIKIISSGNVYRRETEDSRHTIQFKQIEIINIGKNTNFFKLKKTILFFLKKLFGNERKIRLRNSYFPFTEPSIEVDIECSNCLTKGCEICKNEGWLEILGAGLLKEKILENCGYDKNKYNGFAMGMGVERILMLKGQFKDIRDFYSNDLNFLKKFF